MKRFTLRFAFPLVLILWGRSAAYTVDYSEFAYVTRFGEKITILDGSTDAGLHWKCPWPIDSVLRIDRRIQLFDLPPVESLTRDPTNKTVDNTIAVDAYVTWRVPDNIAADRFVRTVGTPEVARRVLAPRITGRLAAVVGSLSMEDLIAIGDDRAIVARNEKIRTAWMQESETGLRAVVRAEYGIELLDLRIRHFSYPEAVRAAIVERIRSERARKVADYESEGRRRAADILSTAEKEAKTTESEARAQKLLFEGRTDAEADRIRNEAHARDPEFYAFLKKLKTYQSILNDTRDVLLLSTKHPLFDLLLAPPYRPDPKK